MAAVRRGHSPMKVDLPTTGSQELPPVSALFLIYFDIKSGYTVSWKRSVSGLEIEGVVEYKSLPSGLHTVKEDLIYFIHEHHAGLSAFVNAPADEESRNAKMIAVGIMVPLIYGRLGRSWKYADKLKEMASELVIDTNKTEILERFWEEHKAEESAQRKEPDSVIDSPTSNLYEATKPVSAQLKGHGRNRSVSDGAALLQHTLSAHHPAWSLPVLLDTFGPLTFPIHRAAILRKRILITGHAPVQETCNFVYDLSILSNIPLAVINLLATTMPPPRRLRPLFSIGVHDIPLLEEDLRASKAKNANSLEQDEAGNGWIACTTDSILAMKSSLYDVLITMPPSHTSAAREKVWPKVESSQGVQLKATQRDLRRYRALRWGLARGNSRPSTPAQNNSTSTDFRASTSSSSNRQSRDNPMLDIPDTESITEPLSWSAIAYSGLMWWASAGEGQRLDIDAEAESDTALLSGLSLTPHTPGHSTAAKPSATQETAIIAYFHRLTAQYLTTISDIVDATESDEDDDEDESEGLVRDELGPTLYVTSNDVERMGLDVWSAGDHKFIVDLTQLYFERRARIQGRNVDICGVRVC